MMAKRNNRRPRRGIATAECALCLPILFLITLGTIEVCSAMFLKEAVTIAAYEGARVGIARRGTNSSATSRIEEFLNERGIAFTENSIDFSDPGFDEAETLEHVTTTVTVPCDGNTFTGWFFPGRSITAEVTLRKEYHNPD
jgi:hypothetical protein